MAARSRIFSGIFYFFMAAVLLLLAWQKVNDTDVWLHLGLGKYIAEHGALPAGDVFTYTSFGQPYEYNEWLFQVSLYLLYKFTGYDGLMVFKLGLWLLTLGLLWQWMRVEGVESGWAVFFTLFPAYWLSGRWNERPEIVAYFFLTLYLYLWALYRHRGRNVLYFLPCLQIIWINLHPSAILGIVVLLVILGGEGGDYLWNKDKAKLPKLQNLGWMIPVLLVACFLNPYGYKTLIYPYLYSKVEVVQKGLTEWVPLWRYPQIHYLYLIFLLFSLLSFVPRFFSPRRDLKVADLFLFILGAPLPYVSVRYVVISAILMFPLAAKNYYWFFNFHLREKIKKFIEKINPNLFALRAAGLGILILISIILFWYAPSRSAFGWGPEKMVIPQKAVAFIQRQSMPGRIFNKYEWGGYLILEAYPRYLPFVDNRAFDSEVYREYAKIMQAFPGWEKQMESRGVNLIMVSALSEGDSGIILPLIVKLFQDPDWALVWSEEGTLLFLRNKPEYQPWLQKALPKERILDEVIAEGKVLIKRHGGGQTYGSLGWAYFMRGNFTEAKAAYQEHLKLNPHDQEARSFRDFLIKRGF